MRKSKSSLDRLNKDRLAAQNKNLELLEKNQVGKKANKKDIKTSVNKKRKALDDKTHTYEKLSLIERHSELIIQEQDNFKEVTPVRSYKEAATLILGAVEHKGIHCLLSWPVGFEWPGLIPALATRALSEEHTTEINLRIMLYPSSRAVAGRYKKTRFPISDLLSEPNALLAKGDLCLNQRQHALLCLKDIEEVECMQKHPTLRELTPTFEWDKDGERWAKLGSDYLEDIYLLLGSVPTGRRKASRRSNIKKYAESFIDPYQASQGMFRIPATVTPKTARRVLCREPADIVMIDMRDNITSRQPRLLGQISKLAEVFAKQPEKPSLFLLFDDLGYMKSLKHNLLNAYKKTPKNHRRNLKPLSEHYWLRSNESCFSQDNNIIVLPEDLVVHVSNATGLHGISKINNLARAEQEHGNAELAKALRRLAGFLRRVIDLPVGQNRLKQWINRTTDGWSETETIRLSSKYLWASYFRRWKDESQGLIYQHTIEKIESIVDDIIVQMSKQTDIEKKLIEILLDLVAEEQKVLILINDNSLAKIIEQKIFDDIDKEASSHIDIMSFDKLQSYSDYDAIVIAGFDRKNYKHIFKSEDVMPKHCHILAGAYSAAMIYRDFTLLREIEAYAKIHKDLDKILDQIKGPVTSFEKLGIPLDIPRGHSDHITPLSDRPEQPNSFAVVDLQGYGLVEVYEHSTLMRRIDQPNRPYEAIYPENIEEGDSVLVMDDSFSDQIESTMSILHPKDRESSKGFVHAYFNMAKDSIQSSYPQKKRVGRAEAILQRMRELDPGLADELNDNMVNRWVKHIEDFSKEDEDISSGSAREKEHFLLFAKTLHLDPSFSEIIWNQGIKALRVEHIQTGRQVNNHLRHLFAGSLPPSSLSLDEMSYQEIMNIAHENTYLVEMITYLEQPINGEVSDA